MRLGKFEDSLFGMGKAEGKVSVGSCSTDCWNERRRKRQNNGLTIFFNSFTLYKVKVKCESASADSLL